MPNRDSRKRPSVHGAGFVHRAGRRRAVLLALSLCALGPVLAGCGGSSPSSTSGATGKTKVSPGAAENTALHNELPASVKKSGVISFGALWEEPPIISTTASNTNVPVGITPELATALGGVLGVKVTWRNMQFPAQLPGLESGNVDALFGQVSDDVQREKVVYLVDFYKSLQSLLVPSGNPKKVTSLANACGLKIGVPLGSLQTQTVEGASTEYCTSKGKPRITPVSYNGEEGAVVAVKSGAIDAWMDSTVSIDELARDSSSSFDSVNIPSAQTAKYSPPDAGIAVAKDNLGLAKALAGAMIELAKNGTYQKIMDKYHASSAVEPVADISVNRYLAAGKSGG